VASTINRREVANRTNPNFSTRRLTSMGFLDDKPAQAKSKVRPGPPPHKAVERG
jgi:Fe2+ transport system protein FeoA